MMATIAGAKHAASYAWRPLVYRASQQLLAPRAAETILECARRVIGDPARIGASLDVGCGPASVLSGLGLQPVGLDVSAHQLKAFASIGHAGCGKAFCGSATHLPFLGRSFGLVWSCGLLHHLADEDVVAALREMTRVTRVGGRVVVFDGVRPDRPTRRPIAALIRRLDRGAFMRRAGALRTLVDLVPGMWTSERVAYAATGLEGLLIVGRPD